MTKDFDCAPRRGRREKASDTLQKLPGICNWGLATSLRVTWFPILRQCAGENHSSLLLRFAMRPCFPARLPLPPTGKGFPLTRPAL